VKGDRHCLQKMEPVYAIIGPEIMSRQFVFHLSMDHCCLLRSGRQPKYEIRLDDVSNIASQKDTQAY
jgi:hypothetical protein